MFGGDNVRFPVGRRTPRTRGSAAAAAAGVDDDDQIS